MNKTQEMYFVIKIALKDWASWLFWRLVLSISCAYFLVVIIGFLPIGRDSTDRGAGFDRSGLAIRVDDLTRCEYLVVIGGGITPRVDGHGRHLGCKA